MIVCVLYHFIGSVRVHSSEGCLLIISAGRLLTIINREIFRLMEIRSGRIRDRGDTAQNTTRVAPMECRTVDISECLGQ